jgi:hypothetical protein
MIRSQAATFPLELSNNSILYKLHPKKTPVRPRTIDPATCPNPHRTVMNMVLTVDQFRDFDNRINGR